MKPVIIIVAFVFVIAVLYFIGSFVSTDTCLSIGSHKQCWNDFPVEVRGSSLCSSNVCTAEPYLQQHNAVVNLLLDACADASSSGFSDSQLNAEITSLFGDFFGSDVGIGSSPSVSVQSICDPQTALLAKRSYDAV